MTQETIQREGQEFVDDPIRVFPKIDPMQVAVAFAFNPAYRPPMPVTVRHERAKLRWMKPVRDEKGEFVRNPDGTVKLVPKEM